VQTDVEHTQTHRHRERERETVSEQASERGTGAWQEEVGKWQLQKY